MIIVMDILNPENDDAAPTKQPVKALEEESAKEVKDYSRLQRVQVISITGQIVDVTL